jgi:hypothetical protein
MDEDVLTDTYWEVQYDVRPHGQERWVFSKSQPLLTEALALELFDGFFDKPHYRNVEVVEVVRTVRWQRKEHGSPTIMNPMAAV